MFNVKNTPAEPEELEGTICDACQLVPLSILSLDHPQPIGDWPAMLAAHGIEVVEDDLGRPAIRREDARQLMEERRQWELAHSEEARRRQEEAARTSRPVPRGIPRPAGADPELSAYAVMRGVDADDEQSDPHRRVSPHEEFLTKRLGPPRKIDVEKDEK